MRPGRLLALATVALALGAYIYFVERHGPTTDELEQRQDKLFPALDPAKIQRVVVTNPKGRFELEKHDDSWKLVTPLADEANSGAVTSLLSVMSGVKAERTLAAKDVKLDDLRLDETAPSVRVTDDKGVESTLSLGVEMPLGTNRAARTGGDVVYVIGNAIATELEKDLTAWRSTKLVRLEPSSAAKLELANGKNVASLERKDGVWKAGGVEVDGEPVSRRLDTLADLTVTGFDRPKPASEATGQVTVTTENGGIVEATFYLDSSAGEAIAVVAGRAGALAIDGGKVGELLADPASLANPKPPPAPTPTAAPPNAATEPDAK